MLDSKLQNLSAEDAAHLMYRGQDPARSGQVSGWAETKPHSSTTLERADVLSWSVNEPLEPGGAGEEGPRTLPHPLATDYYKDQRGSGAVSV
ncbi:hypothetical protein Q5P01_025052 [Channa striata]|uniref:Uncharacterized protein n=1 Tax=Channa striata TaxID=64152 RepID=A0AA88IMN4_CHASR|nr:hypothetical protein Q5P01_025052 [Channa striata]